MSILAFAREKAFVRSARVLASMDGRHRSFHEFSATYPRTACIVRLPRRQGTPICTLEREIREDGRTDAADETSRQEWAGASIHDGAI
jgi:hypothetical protein